MTTPIFPTLRPGWTFEKTPQFKNQIQRSVSGRELRIQYQVIPTWLFMLTYEILADEFDTRQSGGTTMNELRTLMGFYLAQQGTLNTFLFTDPTDYTITGQNIGTGNGSNLVFQLVRTMGTVSGGTFNEPIIAPNVVSNVYVNNVVINPVNYTVNYNNGIVTFNSGHAPGNTLAVTADFTYYFIVRFADDSQEFSNFAWQLWEAKTVKLQSVLL